MWILRVISHNKALVEPILRPENVWESAFFLEVEFAECLYITMNVLLACVGRRNYLVAYFKEALGRNGSVFGADSNRYASALSECDASFVVPYSNSSDYIPHLVGICRDNGVDLLVSLNDLDLPVIARHAADFSAVGTFAAVSSTRVVDICFDKMKSAEFLKSIGVGTLPSYVSIESAKSALERGEISFPFVVKPRWGSGSIMVECAENIRQLETSFNYVREKLHDTILKNAGEPSSDTSVIIQPKLSLPEYGLDIVNDFNGKNAAVFVKRKIRMRAGETDIAETCRIPELSALGAKIGGELGHIGNLDCDIFFDGKNAVVLEMNPRFGGGYPFTHSAGGNVPKAYLQWAGGETASSDCFSAFRVGEVYSKCEKLVRAF